MPNLNGVECALNWDHPVPSWVHVGAECICILPEPMINALGIQSGLIFMQQYTISAIAQDPMGIWYIALQEVPGMHRFWRLRTVTPNFAPIQKLTAEDEHTATTRIPENV